MTSSDAAALEFAHRKAWAAWLDKNHGKSSGIWVRLAKKGSAGQSVTYSEALEVALCFGWIDGQKKGESEAAWLQKFIPRANRSIWSKINRKKALALIEAGRMKPAGLRASSAPKRMGLGTRLMILQAPLRCRMIYKLHWIRMPGRRLSSRHWIAKTGTPSYTEFRPSRRPRRAAEKSNSSSRCWHGMRNCIRDRPWGRECTRMNANKTRLNTNRNAFLFLIRVCSRLFAARTAIVSEARVDSTAEPASPIDASARMRAKNIQPAHHVPHVAPHCVKRGILLSGQLILSMRQNG